MSTGNATEAVRRKTATPENHHGNQLVPETAETAHRKTEKTKKYLRTIYLPNSSPVPNFIFDELLSEPDIPHSVIRVLFFLLRKTIGWNNKYEELSLTRVQDGASVTRPTAIYAIRVIVDCWGLFRKTRGRMGQYSSVFTIGDLSRDAWGDRGSLLIGIYGTLCPTPSQLRKQPCTPQLLDWERAKREAEERHAR